MLTTINATSALNSQTSTSLTENANEGLASNIHSISSCPADKLPTELKSGLILICGEQGFDDKNTAYSLLGQQVPRVFSKKTPYPTLFLHENAKLEFEKFSQPISQVEKHEHLESPDTDLAVGAALGFVAKEQKNLSMIDINLNDFEKVYISGHGVAGEDSILSGNSFLTAKELVDALEKNGILNKTKDIRLTNCGSADKSDVDSLTKEGIDRANNYSGLLNRIFYGKKESFLEKVAHEVWRRGYHDIKLSGYHGKGVFYNGKDIPMTHLRSPTIPATDVVKRETVRKTLILESGVD